MKQFNTSVGERLTTKTEFPSPPHGATCRSPELTKVYLFYVKIRYKPNQNMFREEVTVQFVSAVFVSLITTPRNTEPFFFNPAKYALSKSSLSFSVIRVHSVSLLLRLYIVHRSK